MLDPMILAILEEEGCTDTRAGHINRIARYIATNYGGDMDFEEACIACNVDRTEFTLEDIEKIQEIINKTGV